MVSKMGVLLKAKASTEQVAVIEFGLDGMLVNSIIKPGVHVFALRSVMKLLDEKGFQPLYKKYEAQKDEAGNLPRDILRAEAEACANIINGAEMTIAGIAVIASVEEWQEQK